MRRQCDRLASRRKTGDAAESDAMLDEALRQIDAEILEEPIPEKLRRILRGERGGAEQCCPARDQEQRATHR
jgi:hypothetical protein